MKKILLSAIVLCFPALFVAVEVSVSELESAQGQVQFQNYVGPHRTVDTRTQIVNIGTALAAGGDGDGVYAGGRYRIIHAADPAVNSGLDADVLVIGENATVDHIRNLRLIISAYLAAYYGYTNGDAATLAAFITVYNAVYHGRIEVFTQKYKPVVLRNLSAETAGLSTSYRDWPGKTRIVIPVYDPQGGLNAIDTSAISDQAVVDSLRNEDDKGIPAREQLADIKDREAEARDQSAVQAEQQAAEARQRADEEQRKLQAEQRGLTDSLKAAAEAKNRGEPGAETKQIASEKQAGDTSVQAAEAKKAEAEAKQAEFVAQAARESADQKKEEVRQDREQIAQDKGEIASQTEAAAVAAAKRVDASAAPPAAPVYGLQVVDGRTFLSAIVKVNSADGSILSESPVKVVRGRTMFVMGKQFVVIAGEPGDNTTVKLVLIDGDTLGIAGESAETVAENGVLMSDGKNFWTVVKVNNAWAIGRYDASIRLQASSAVPVIPETALTSTAAGIIATGADGKARLFKFDTLAELQ